MYLDDGIAGTVSFDEALNLSHLIQGDLEKFGFLIANEKCQWIPSRKVTWLGLVWDTLSCTIHLTNERLHKMQYLIYLCNSVHGSAHLEE